MLLSCIIFAVQFFTECAAIGFTHEIIEMKWLIFFFQQVSVSASLSLPFCAQFLHNWPTVCQAIHYSLWMWRPLFLTADLSTPKSLSLPMMIPALHLEKKKKEIWAPSNVVTGGRKGVQIAEKKTVVPRVHTKDGEVIFIKLDYLHYKML